jgi:hypothetical protein
VSAPHAVLVLPGAVYGTCTARVIAADSSERRFLTWQR